MFLGLWIRVFAEVTLHINNYEVVSWQFLKYNTSFLLLQKEVVYKKKESIFSLEESEFRQPAVLTLQVWDYDRIAANDFLGEEQQIITNISHLLKHNSNYWLKHSMFSFIQ